MKGVPVYQVSYELVTSTINTIYFHLLIKYVCELGISYELALLVLLILPGIYLYLLIKYACELLLAAAAVSNQAATGSVGCRRFSVGQDERCCCCCCGYCCCCCGYCCCCGWRWCSEQKKRRGVEVLCSDGVIHSSVVHYVLVHNECWCWMLNDDRPIKWFLPKTGIPGHFCAKKKVVLKPSTHHTPGALRLASVTSYLFSAWKGQVHLFLSTLYSFQLFLANFEPIRGHTLVTRNVSYDVW